jgi:Polyketide cyclase / dehydrase and lipid transport
MKLALIIVASVFTVVAVVLIVGAVLPRSHVVSRRIILHRSPNEIYQSVRDFNAAPSWRSDLERVEMIATTDNHVRFREYAKHGAVTYELVEDQPGERMVTRIADLNLGYSGTWTYTFTKDAAGTRVQITEAGEVSNLLFRFMSRFVFGQSGTIEKYLIALGEKFGEDVSPRS